MARTSEAAKQHRKELDSARHRRNAEQKRLQEEAQRQQAEEIAGVKRERGRLYKQQQKINKMNGTPAKVGRPPKAGNSVPSTPSMAPPSRSHLLESPMDKVLQAKTAGLLDKDEFLAVADLGKSYEQTLQARETTQQAQETTEQERVGLMKIDSERQLLEVKKDMLETCVYDLDSDELKLNGLKAMQGREFELGGSSGDDDQKLPAVDDQKLPAVDAKPLPDATTSDITSFDAKEEPSSEEKEGYYSEDDDGSDAVYTMKQPKKHTPSALSNGASSATASSRRTSSAAAAGWNGTSSATASSRRTSSAAAAAAGSNGASSATASSRRTSSAAAVGPNRTLFASAKKESAKSPESASKKKATPPPAIENPKEAGGANLQANSSKAAAAPAPTLFSRMLFGSFGSSAKQADPNNSTTLSEKNSWTIVIGSSEVHIDRPSEESVVWNPTRKKGQPLLVKDDLNGNMVLVLTQLLCSKKDCMLGDNSECCCRSNLKSLQYVGVDGRSFFNADAIDPKKVCHTPWPYKFKVGQSVVWHEDPFLNGDGIFPIVGITAGVKNESGEIIGVPMYILRCEFDGATVSVNEHAIELWTSKGTDDDDNGLIKGRVNLDHFRDDDDDDDEDVDAAGMMPESNRKSSPSKVKSSNPSAASNSTPTKLKARSPFGLKTVYRDSESSADDDNSPKAEGGAEAEDPTAQVAPSPASQSFFASTTKSPSKKNSSSSSSSRKGATAAAGNDADGLVGKKEDGGDNEESIITANREQLSQELKGKKLKILKALITSKYKSIEIGKFNSKQDYVDAIVDKAYPRVGANDRRTLGHGPPKTPAKNSGLPPLGRSTVKKPAKKPPPPLSASSSKNGHGQPPAEDETGTTTKASKKTESTSSTKKRTAKKRDKDPEDGLTSPPLARRTRASRKAADDRDAAAAVATPSASTKTKNKRATPSSKQGAPSKRAKTRNAASPVAAAPSAAATSSNESSSAGAASSRRMTKKEQNAASKARAADRWK
eukprot:CAMPEP_0113493878 /NCGR_PEP_ID=MMETSP0014_2-20120614/28820_1 /TAXON_ID=2857 /ORGANISM="Nitzschia sp." /LENGTH=999 /DNA_ID=CAMNT_0000387757 /DNA_START=1701 /DNA_END=4700 /DNA_ORIENTATION=+ /assembly_acc=CAM_ASM_000159